MQVNTVRTLVAKNRMTTTVSIFYKLKKKFFFHFKPLEAVADPSGEYGFMFGFSTNSLTIKEESYLYPFQSFLAEVGGSLGLFLGLSFLSLWDFFLVVLKVCSFKFTG